MSKFGVAANPFFHSSFLLFFAFVRWLRWKWQSSVECGGVWLCGSLPVCCIPCERNKDKWKRFSVDFCIVCGVRAYSRIIQNRTSTQCKIADDECECRWRSPQLCVCQWPLFISIFLKKITYASRTFLILQSYDAVPVLCVGCRQEVNEERRRQHRRITTNECGIIFQLSHQILHKKYFYCDSDCGDYVRRCVLVNNIRYDQQSNSQHILIIQIFIYFHLTRRTYSR